MIEYKLNNQNGDSCKVQEANEGITVNNSGMKPVSRYGVGKRVVAGLAAGFLLSTTTGCGYLNKNFNIGPSTIYSSADENIQNIQIGTIDGEDGKLGIESKLNVPEKNIKEKVKGICQRAWENKYWILGSAVVVCVVDEVLDSGSSGGGGSTPTTPTVPTVPVDKPGESGEDPSNGAGRF